MLELPQSHGQSIYWCQALEVQEGSMDSGSNNL
jgi:hypothetical protein